MMSAYLPRSTLPTSAARPSSSAALIVIARTISISGMPASAYAPMMSRPAAPRDMPMSLCMSDPALDSLRSLGMTPAQLERRVRPFSQAHGPCTLEDHARGLLAARQQLPLPLLRQPAGGGYDQREDCQDMPRPYEAVYVFDSTLEDAAVTEKLDRFHQLLGTSGDLKVDHWCRRQLAYPIGPPA